MFVLEALYSVPKASVCRVVISDRPNLVIRVFFCFRALHSYIRLSSRRNVSSWKPVASHTAAGGGGGSDYTFMQYSIAFCRQPEADSDVIFGEFVKRRTEF